MHTLMISPCTPHYTHYHPPYAFLWSQPSLCLLSMPCIWCTSFGLSFFPTSTLLPMLSMCLYMLLHQTTSMHSTHVLTHSTHLFTTLWYLPLLISSLDKLFQNWQLYTQFIHLCSTLIWRWCQLGSLIGWWEDPTTGDRSCVKLGLRLSTSAVNWEVTLSNLHHDTMSLCRQVIGDSVQSLWHNVTLSSSDRWQCSIIVTQCNSIIIHQSGSLVTGHSHTFNEHPEIWYRLLFHTTLCTACLHTDCQLLPLTIAGAPQSTPVVPFPIWPAKLWWIGSGTQCPSCNVLEALPTGLHRSGPEETWNNHLSDALI